MSIYREFQRFQNRFEHLVKNLVSVRQTSQFDSVFKNARKKSDKNVRRKTEVVTLKNRKSLNPWILDAPNWRISVFEKRFHKTEAS